MQFKNTKDLLKPIVPPECPERSRIVIEMNHIFFRDDADYAIAKALQCRRCDFVNIKIEPRRREDAAQENDASHENASEESSVHVHPSFIKLLRPDDF